MSHLTINPLGLCDWEIEKGESLTFARCGKPATHFHRDHSAAEDVPTCAECCADAMLAVDSAVTCDIDRPAREARERKMAADFLRDQRAMVRIHGATVVHSAVVSEFVESWSTRAFCGRTTYRPRLATNAAVDCRDCLADASMMMLPDVTDRARGLGVVA